MQSGKRFEQVQKEALFKMRSKYHSQTLTNEVAEQQKRAENSRGDIKRLSAQLVDLRNMHYRCSINRQRLLRNTKRGTASHGVQELEMQMNTIRGKARRIAESFPTYSVDQDSSFFVSLRLLRVASYFRGDFLTRPPIATRLALQHHLQHTYMMEANHAASFTAVLPFLSLRYTGRVVADPTAVADHDELTESPPNTTEATTSPSNAMGKVVGGVAGSPKQLLKHASRRSNLGDGEDEPEEAILVDGDEMLDDKNFRKSNVATSAGGGPASPSSAWQEEHQILPPSPPKSRSTNTFTDILSRDQSQQPLLLNLDAALKIMAPRLKQLCPEFTPRETMGIAVALARAEDASIALSNCGVSITSPLAPSKEALTAGDVMMRLENMQLKDVDGVGSESRNITSFETVDEEGAEEDVLFNAELADAGLQSSSVATASGSVLDMVSSSFGPKHTLDKQLSESLLNCLSEATIVCEDHDSGAIMSRFIYSLSKVSPQVGAAHLYAIRHRLSMVVYSMTVADLVQLCRGISKTRACDRRLMNDISRRALDLLGEMTPLHIADILHTLHLTNTRHSVLLKRAAARQLILLEQQDLVTVSLTLSALAHFSIFDNKEVFTGLVERVLGGELEDSANDRRRVSREAAASALAESPVAFASIAMSLAKANIVVPRLFAGPLGIVSHDESLLNPEASAREIRSSLQVLTTLLWACSVFKVGVVGVSVSAHQDVSVQRILEAVCGYVEMVTASSAANENARKKPLSAKDKSSIMTWMCNKSSVHKMLSEICAVYAVSLEEAASAGTKQPNSNNNSNGSLEAAVKRLSDQMMGLQ